MKKLIYCALALAAGLFATSCQQENLEPVQGGTTVTYTVEMPQVATKAVGEADYVNKLVYAVYRVTNTDLNDEQVKATLATVPGDFQLMYQEVTPVFTDTQSGKKLAHLSLELINDQRYVVIFWAQKDYTWVNLEDEFTTVEYPPTLDGNKDEFDAFTGVDVISVDGSVSKNITLVRPFAQLNIATVVPGPTAEYPDRYTDFQIANTSVVVNGIAQSFNVGAQVGETKGEVSFTEAAPVNQNFNDTYPAYVSMNYVFVLANQSNVTVSYDINTNKYGTVENTVPNVPLARNYRTNIIGNLLTSEVDYNVELAPWAENTNTGTTEVIVDGLIKNQNGDYEVYTAVGLAHAINHHFVNAEGVANSATFYIKPGLYDMAQQAIKDVTVKSGTLKVYDTEAVVTRSASINNVIITGLKKAMINTVEEGATVFFSGITIKDFEGESNAAALVQDNLGKVVLAGCDIVDENGDTDMDTELVVGNEPVEVEKGEEAATDLIYTAEQLAAAFADETVESIVLGADIALENTLVFPEGRTATLDLRGWELTIADPDKVATTYALNNHGTLTIKDSYATGSVNARGIYNGYVAGGDPIATATLTIESGTFNAKGTDGGAAVINYGIAEIKGGKFTSIGGYSLNNQGGASMTISEGVKVNNGIYNSGATLTINGGEIEGNRSGCHVVYSWNSTVTIKGGTIHNNNSGNSTLMAAGTSEMTVTGGTFSIKDGRVEGNGNTWTSCLTDTQHTATLTVTGGTFNGGFRVQGGTTMNISGGTFNDVGGSGYNVYTGATIEITGGSYNIDVNKWCHKDYKAVKNAETTMWDVVAKVYVAEVVGGEKYETLQEAVNAAQDGATIELLSNETFTETNRYNNGGWWDGLGYSGDKSFTIDLGGYTISQQDGALNDYLMWFKNDGAKPNTITLKNGTMDAGTTAYCALATASSNAQKITINLESINLINNNSNGATIKLRAGAELNVKAGTIITGKNSYVGMEVVGSETVANIYDGAKIYQNGTSSSWGFLVGASWGATVNVYGGEGVSARGGFMAMTSGGTINISGGQWTANVDGTIGNNSNVYVLTAQNNKYESCYTGASIINVTDGTFRGGMDAWVLNDVNVEKAELNIKGGNFNANPSSYVENGYRAAEDNGIWNVTDAQVYTEAALKAALMAGGEIILGSDITLTENWTPVPSFEGVFDGNNHKIKGLKIEGHEYGSFIDTIIEGTVIKNIEFENVSITSATYASAVVSLADKNTTFENVKVSGTIEASAYASGILWYSYEGLEMKDCENRATINSNRSAGIVAWVETNAYLENVKNYSNITAGSAAGIANRFGGTIKNAYNYGDIIAQGSEPASGIVCIQKGASTYENCHNYGDITSLKDDVNASASGILGHTPSTAATLNYCANYGAIKAENSYASGLAYSLHGSAKANYCYNSGVVTGAKGAGAIMAQAAFGNGDTASYCLNAATVTSTTGLVYQAAEKNVSSYYYDDTTLKSVADDSVVAEADVLAVLNGGTDKDFFSTDNGKITVK